MSERDLDIDTAGAKPSKRRAVRDGIFCGPISEPQSAEESYQSKFAEGKCASIARRHG